ncbi:hypothetical protein STRIP9103_07077 [Streptomyces ipomoeae 91-03]|uniref:Uncharacterized protein n=1 Tax=Streptomyces ipomoeae 91-03 TaxID=698759 RepID=L1KZ45_9ACTN|nr:hypothetical protein STRIP9103_07077 [Streptomyces ipomoeae 91-03]
MGRLLAVPVRPGAARIHRAPDRGSERRRAARLHSEPGRAIAQIHVDRLTRGRMALPRTRRGSGTSPRAARANIKLSEYPV